MEPAPCYYCSTIEGEPELHPNQGISRYSQPYKGPTILHLYNCVKPLRDRLEAIQKLQPLTTVKGCRSFTGMVNFCTMFCPELQKLLKLIYDLTRKGRQFVWEKEQQDSFEEIKHRLIKPPVLHMPNMTGRFHLYSDTSKFATGSVLYQMQNGKHKLIAYASKRLPEAAKTIQLQN